MIGTPFRMCSIVDHKRKMNNLARVCVAERNEIIIFLQILVVARQRATRHANIVNAVAAYMYLGDSYKSGHVTRNGVHYATLHYATLHVIRVSAEIELPFVQAQPLKARPDSLPSCNCSFN